MQTALLILQVIPLIIDIIKAIEAAIPVSGQGKEKLDAVIEMVKAAVPKLAEAIPAITNIINAIVGLFNRTGVFQKAGA